jgi:hypothetical protein
MSDTYPALKYPWQKAVLDVFREFDPGGLPAKIEIAERAIAERLGDGTPIDESEYTAIGDVQRAFQLLFPKRIERKKAAGKSDAA